MAGFAGTFARRPRYPSRFVEPGKALITGGAGFIGSHLSELLLDEGWEVYALDDLSTGRIDNVEQLRDQPRFHLVVDSVLSPAVVSELVHKCDVVYHLAAAVGVRLIVEQPVHTIVTNLAGTEIVLDYCSRSASACCRLELGGLRRPRDRAAASRRRPPCLRADDRTRWLYADSKAMDEFLALAYHQERDLDCVIARLFNTVGPRQSGQYGMVIPRFVERAVAGEPLEIHGDGSQTRSFCHVQDTIRALHALVAAPGADGQIYNVGSPERISIGDLAQPVLALTGSSSGLVTCPTTRSTASGSRMCCTACRRSRRSPRRSAGRRRAPSTTSSTT